MSDTHTELRTMLVCPFRNHDTANESPQGGLLLYIGGIIALGSVVGVSYRIKQD